MHYNTETILYFSKASAQVLKYQKNKFTRKLVGIFILQNFIYILAKTSTKLNIPKHEKYTKFINAKKHYTFTKFCRNYF